MVKMGTEEMLRIVIEGLQERKAKDLVSLDLQKMNNPVCRYFVICHGDSSTHVKSIADSVEEYVKQNNGGVPYNVEGVESGQWVLVDFADVVVHIFQRETREHYKLEDLWADAIAKEYE
jgi:ribosome-associated protein